MSDPGFPGTTAHGKKKGEPAWGMGEKVELAQFEEKNWCVKKKIINLTLLMEKEET